MASLNAIATRRALALARLEALMQLAAEQFGVEVPEPSQRVAQADLAQAMMLERMSTMLGAVLTSVGVELPADPSVVEPEPEPEPEIVEEPVDDSDPLEGSIADLTERLASMDNVRELKALAKREAKGKDRVGALAAITERIEELG